MLDNTNKFRANLKLYVLSVFLFLFFTPLKANDLQQAETYIQNTANDIISIVENNLTVEQKQEALLSLFKQNASVVTISRAALGARWRKEDQSTRRKFIKAFTHYLIKKYGRQFEEFSGAKLINERSIDAGKRGILVYTRLIMPATSPISVKWQVWRKDENFKLLDIIIEDVSMLTMEREEIKNRLEIHGDSIDLLISDLEKN